MMLRIQLERQGKTLLPTLREYARFYGLNPANLQLAKEDAIVMHPGPMNRGVEISSFVADGPQNVILEQVENGVAVAWRFSIWWRAGSMPSNFEF